MPGPPKTPATLTLLRGNPGHERKRPPEPQPAILAECPPPPNFLADYAAEEWHHVAPELHRLGLLTVLDVSMLAAYCCSYARWRWAEELLPSTTDRKACSLFARISRDSADTMLRIGREFGMTPSSRSHINGSPPRGPSKFDGLIGEPR